MNIKRRLLRVAIILSLIVIVFGSSGGFTIGGWDIGLVESIVFVVGVWFLYFLIRFVVRGKSLRGRIGEKKTTFNMWLSLGAKTYRRFHDVIIPAKNGTAQIDHLLVSPYGLFIVETKNIKGWIFGSENEPKWTQVLYREKYSFQNPLRQTFRQKKILSEYLDLDESIIHTVVYFVGDCSFKTPLPANVINYGLGTYIKQFKYRILPPDDIDRVIRALERHVSESSFTTRDHVRSLHQRYASYTVCPKCGSNLVERTAKKGPYAGTKFFGCESYPKCRFTKNA